MEGTAVVLDAVPGAVVTTVTMATNGWEAMLGAEGLAVTEGTAAEQAGVVVVVVVDETATWSELASDCDLDCVEAIRELGESISGALALAVLELCRWLGEDCCNSTDFDWEGWRPESETTVTIPSVWLPMVLRSGTVVVPLERKSTCTHHVHKTNACEKEDVLGPAAPGETSKEFS